MIVGLAYLLLESERLDEWHRFCHELLGLQVNAEAEHLSIRCDHHDWRIKVRKGASESLVALGLEVNDDPSFEALLRTIGGSGTPIAERTDLADARGVLRLARFVDPAGMPVELVLGCKVDHIPFSGSHAVSWLTDSGFGHVALFSHDGIAQRKFYEKYLGMCLTDVYLARIEGLGEVRADFIRCAQRHHLFAVATVPGGFGLRQLALEVADLDAVGHLQDRAQRDGFTLSATLGRHSNDGMISCYVRSPSGFDVEVGCNLRRIFEGKDHLVLTYSEREQWGHKYVGPQPTTLAFKGEAE